MDTDKKIMIWAAQHNFNHHFIAGELTPFFKDGARALHCEAYLAACLCFLTGIEMSLRLPLLFKHGKDIRTAGKIDVDIPLLKNDLLLKAKKLGLPVHLLKYPDEDLAKFNADLPKTSWQDQVKIVQMRNNLCHGNLNILVNTDDPESPKIFTKDIECEARTLSEISTKWSENYNIFSRIEPE
jgi:hypothetical protein